MLIQRPSGRFCCSAVTSKEVCTFVETPGFHGIMKLPQRKKRSYSMGQYFYYSLADASEGFRPNGLKVMEHSYVGNADVFHFFLRLVDKESLLASFISSVINTSSLDDLLGSWAGKAVAHAGDYEEVEEGQKNIYEKLSDASKCRAQNQF